MGQANRGELECAAWHGVQVRAVRDCDITPDEAGELLAARPGWLIAEQQRRQAQTARETQDRLRRKLTDALVTSVHEAWLQERKHAVSATVDARWAPEIRRARQEARQLSGELSAEQVRARIGRERDTSYQAACYRAGQPLRRALGGDDGQV